MSHRHFSKGEVSYTPCPPEEFAGRSDKREKLLEILSKVRHHGQVVLVSGARGSGKTSFLDWAEYEIQDKSGGLESPVIKRAFLETPGMIFTTYKELLTELKGHQKFGWFRKALDNPNVRKSIEAVLAGLERASSAVGPGKLGVELGVDISREFLPAQIIQYSQLLSSFLSVFRNLSGVLMNNQLLTILCDDAQWSSEPDYHLLKDLIRNLPSGIAFVITFRLETGSMEKYLALRQELDRFGHTEIRLTGMTSEEVKDFAIKRYGLSINDSTAEFLSLNIGDPLCLVSCFNLLQRCNLEPSMANIRQTLPEAVNPARCIYSGLNELWQERVNSLCILRPPLPLSLIACMLVTEESYIARLQDEFDQSVVFRRLEKESYDFAHPSLREYRRKELPEGVLIGLHARAAGCFETLADRLADQWSNVLSLAEHLFFGQEYEKALGLNLLAGDRLYDLFDFNLALQLTDRARACAEKTDNKPMLAIALHQKGLMLQSTFEFTDSLDAYNQSLTIKREIGDRGGEAKTLHQIGIVYQLTNRFDKALDYYQQSLTIKREIGDRAYEATTLHQIGRVYQLTNRFDKALDYYQQSLAIEREIGDRGGEAKTLHQIGMVYEETNRFDEALDYYQQSLTIEREIGDRAYEAKTLHQIGMVYQLTNRFDEALDYYQQSLTIEREIGDRGGEATTLHQIGMVYQETNRFDEALDYYQQSLTIEREIGNRGNEASTLHQIGMVYQETNRFDEALDYYQQSLTIEREIGNKSGEAVSLRTIKGLEEKMRKKKGNTN